MSWTMFSRWFYLWIGSSLDVSSEDEVMLEPSIPQAQRLVPFKGSEIWSQIYMEWRWPREGGGRDGNDGFTSHRMLGLLATRAGRMRGGTDPQSLWRKHGPDDNLIFGLLASTVVKGHICCSSRSVLPWGTTTDPTARERTFKVDGTQSLPELLEKMPVNLV